MNEENMAFHDGTTRREIEKYPIRSNGRIVSGLDCILDGWLESGVDGWLESR